MNFSRKNLVLIPIVIGWLVAAGWGMWQLADYSLAPGAQGDAPSDWPAAATTPRPQGFTLVVALHPECPCSRATLEELDAIVAESAGRLHVRALFVELPGLDPAHQSTLWARAQRIAAVHSVKDPHGAEAARFGALTSGETRLYSPTGRLLFRGGITAARGHVGDNPGHTAIVALLTQPPPATLPITTPVFGCELGIGETSPQ